MSRKHLAPLSALSVTVLLCSVSAIQAQVVTRTGSTRTVSARTEPNAWRTMRYDTALLAPTNAAARPGSDSPYQFLRASLKPNTFRELNVRRASNERSVALPPPPIDRVYRGQQPADTRPRLNDVPGEIVREEIVPADSRPRLNSPRDVFRNQPRSFSSPACQSPATTYYRSGYPAKGLGRTPTTSFYSSPANPGGLPESRYQIGRGIIGQPTLYVQKQPLRNFVRWLTY